MPPSEISAEGTTADGEVAPYQQIVIRQSAVDADCGGHVAVGRVGVVGQVKIVGAATESERCTFADLVKKIKTSGTLF